MTVLAFHLQHLLTTTTWPLIVEALNHCKGKVSNLACTDEGQPCSQETHTIGRAGHKKGVKIKRNGNWIDAAMAVAISTINKGMGIR